MFRPPAIETKCIFVEIPLKVFVRNSALVCRPEPAFDERSNQVNMGEVPERTFRISQNGRDLMNISGALHAVVFVPIVRMHLGSFFDTIHYEPNQTLARSVGNMAQTNTTDLFAIQFDRDRYQGFPDQLTACDTGFLATHVTLVDFHGSR